MSGVTGQQREALYVLPASITKNAWTTEAAFTGVAGTNTLCELPAGLFAVQQPNPISRVLYLFVSGTIQNTAAATFAVNLGLDTTPGTKANSTTVYAATAPTASVTATWFCHAWYTITAYATSTMTVQVNGYWEQEAAASGAALNANKLTASFNGSLASLDPRVAFYIELFGTWSASSASNQTVVQQMMLECLN